MIKKSILTFLLLFCVYSIFTIWISPKWWHASQHQWQDNTIKAQNYLYDDTSNFKNIIVGSSLSCRLIMDSLPGVYNLSFAGQTIFDGLEIITHKTKFPKNIFIEMNVLLREQTTEFTSNLNSPFLFYPRKVLPSLRFDKQPIAITGHFISNRITNPFLKKLKRDLHLTEQKRVPSDSSTSLFSKMLTMQLKSYSELPDERILNMRFITLKKYTDQLEKLGLNVIFFEIPVNYLLNDLPKAKTIRECFYLHYPASSYTYIPIDRFTKYETTDGVHLKREEALEYTRYFRLKMKNLKL